MIGPSYLGTFPVDVSAAVIAKRSLLFPTSSFIINVDNSSESGSHWLSVIKDKNGVFHIYDSFARGLKKLIPKFLKTVKHKYVKLNVKSDQKDSEDNCGQRSLSVLIFHKKYGIKDLKKI
jgi:hypothetical protein